MVPAGDPFGLVLRRPEIPSLREGPALIELAKTLHGLGVMPSYGPGDHGNLSCRTPTGCLFTARQTHKAALRPDQLVSLVGYESTPRGACLMFDGKVLPSTDALMHWRLYERRADVGAIIHGHDPQALAKAVALELPVTHGSGLTNSVELIDEVVVLAAAHDYILLRDHGVVALGTTISAALGLIRQWLDRARL